jgi:hexosaminidase
MMNWMALLLSVLSVGATSQGTSHPVPSLIPRPVSVEATEGAFIFNRSTRVVASGSAEAEAANFVVSLAPAFGFRLAFASEEDARGNVVRFELDDSLSPRLGDEGYTLVVTPDRIDIAAARNAGLFYAIQTLRQLLPAAVIRESTVEGAEWAAPCVRIADYPRFRWRGLLIDPARHFIPKRDVMRFIDAMALHKFNRLQMHLTDDQGWRIEIEKYPLLTEVGAWRDETLIGHARESPMRFDGTRHGGFYSQEDVRELTRYAADRHITIVPEIEMPGHSRAAIASYPRLGVFPDRMKGIGPWTQWGVCEDILAPRPETVEFCKDVLTEVMELFPSRFIHIGGDEAKKTQWKASPEIQQLIVDNGVRDETELQAWFTKCIAAFLEERGRRLVGWDEILEGGLPSGAVVMSWRGEEGGVTAAQAGHDVIMAPVPHTYFDSYQGPSESEPLAIGRHISLEKAYDYEPVPSSLTSGQAKHVLGAQAQLWSEYIPNPEHLQYMAFPRACAFCEVLWSPPEREDFESFLDRLKRHLERLDAMNVNYRSLDE